MSERTPSRLPLRQRLQNSHVFGAWTSLGHPSIAEVFTRAGVDFIGIDLEHSTIDQQQAQRIIAAAHAGGTACLPRLASHSGEQIKRLLDSGGDGVIVPMVSTPSEVHRIVDSCKYPPNGRRAYGVARAQAYGLEFDEYVRTWNERCTIILQIESIAGVEASNELLAHPEVDGVMVGPYDLSGSIGIPGQLSDRRVIEASQHVIDMCRRHRKACGTHLIEPREQTIREALASGYTFLVLASDVFILSGWSRQTNAILSSLQPR